MTLRAIARTFIPGNSKHVINKNVTWIGITDVRRFIIEPCDALPKRSLNFKPSSSIKNADPNEATPFSIPETTIDELTEMIACGYSLNEIEDTLNIDNSEDFIDWSKYMVLTDSDNIEQISIKNQSINDVDWTYENSIIPSITKHTVDNKSTKYWDK